MGFLLAMLGTAAVTLVAVAVGALLAGRRTATVEARFDRLLRAREAESARVLNLLLASDVHAFAVLQSNDAAAAAPRAGRAGPEWDEGEVTYEYPDELPDHLADAALDGARRGG